MSPLEVQAVADALRNGASATTLAEQFGVSRQTIYNAAKAAKDGRVAPPREGAPLPQKRQRAKRITPALREVVCDWRKKYPTWGVGFLQRELVTAGYAPVSVPSIYKILREAGLAGRAQPYDKAFKRFSMIRPGQLYQVDIQGTVVLPTLGAVHGVAVLDDYSRYCAAFIYFQDEKMSNAIIALNLAIQRHGVPEAVYVDNGAQFRSRGARMNNFELFCAAWGIKVVASTPYRPQGKGKVERFFKTVEYQFLSRARVTAAEDPTYTLVRLNKDLQEYLQGQYHPRQHGGTGKPPAELFATGKLRPADESVDLTRYLERSSPRKVNKYGEVSYQGYKVQVNLAPHVQVTVVETIESLRVEHAGELVRVVDKANLTREVPISFQDGVLGERPAPVASGGMPGSKPPKDPAPVPESEVPAEAPSDVPVVRANTHRWGHKRDAEGYQERKVRPDGTIKFNGRLYDVGAERAGEAVLAREEGTSLFIHDARKVLLKQVALGAGRPAIDPSRAEISTPAPDVEGALRRKVSRGGALSFQDHTYFLSRGYVGRSVQVKESNGVLHVFNLQGKLIKKIVIKGSEAPPCSVVDENILAGESVLKKCPHGPLDSLETKDPPVRPLELTRRWMGGDKHDDQGFYTRAVGKSGSFSFAGRKYALGKQMCSKKVLARVEGSTVVAYTLEKQLVRKFDIVEGTPQRDESKKAGKGFYLRKVGVKGVISLQRVHYHVGNGWAGQTVWVLRTTEIIYVYNTRKELIKKIPAKNVTSPRTTENKDPPQ